jgi:hypothetical protein
MRASAGLLAPAAGSRRVMWRCFRTIGMKKTFCDPRASRGGHSIGASPLRITDRTETMQIRGAVSVPAPSRGAVDATGCAARLRKRLTSRAGRIAANAGKHRARAVAPSNAPPGAGRNSRHRCHESLRIHDIMRRYTAVLPSNTYCPPVTIKRHLRDNPALSPDNENV